MRTMHKPEFLVTTTPANLSIDEFLEDKPWSACLVLSYLQQLNKGQLLLTLPDKSQIELIGEKDLHHKAVLNIKNWKVFRRILLHGEVGFGEGFIAGEWESPNLTELLSLFIENQADGADGQEPFFIFNWFYKLQSWLTKNTPRQSVNNIRTHYDLGNKFYKLWLDPSMTYSSALFGGKRRTLEEAQQAKYNRILDRLNPQPGAKILDIGCGWGGFAAAASQRGCEVKGITLSMEQFLYAQERAKKFPAPTHFLFSDYREATGQYDYVVSIGMLEHVGKNYWNTYFKKIYELLKPGGKAMIQTIIYAGGDYYNYTHGIDFIRLYIFPGGFLPKPNCVEECVSQAGLEVNDEFEFGMDYAKTIACWRENFLTAWDDIMRLGFDEKFKRLWLYYLSACEAAFLTRKTSVMQFELVKPA